MRTNTGVSPHVEYARLVQAIRVKNGLQPLLEVLPVEDPERFIPSMREELGLGR